MGKFVVPSKTRTPADRVREALYEAERIVGRLRGCGPQVLRLLHLFDQASVALAELEAAGVDVRAERVRLETAQRQLRRHKRRFLAEAGAALQEERSAVKPERAHWWWFLDEIRAEQRKKTLRRILIWATVGILLLTGAWMVYDRFIAPPPEIRQAIRHTLRGETLVEQSDLEEALTEFEAATVLNPDDSLPWLWIGVIRAELGEPDVAEEMFDAARPLYETEYEFLLDRGIAYLQVGNLDAAGADIEQAIRQEPELGQGYYRRAVIAAARENYDAAIADLERAADLAKAAGDSQLEAMALTQRAMILEMQSYRRSPGGQDWGD